MTGRPDSKQLAGPTRREFGCLFMRITLKRPNREQVFQSYLVVFFLSKREAALHVSAFAAAGMNAQCHDSGIAVLLSL